MPDQSWVTKETGELNVCWSLDIRRTEIDGVVESVILGPKFGAVFKSFSNPNYPNMWDVSAMDTASEEFRNIFAFLEFLGPFGIYQSFKKNPAPGTLVWNETSEVNATCVRDIAYIPPEYPKKGLPISLKGWQFLGVDQDLTVDEQDIFKVDPPNATRTIRLLHSVFELNDSIPYQRGAVPYNSSLWYNGTSIHLKAPFLDVNFNCAWWPTALGECICYKGKLLTEDFRIDSHKLCTGGGNYVWGFSHFITCVGLVLEFIWCLICLCLWIFSTQRSNLAKHGRPATGAVRSILDLSEVVNERLGDNTCWYTDKQLRKALKSSHMVRYATKERVDGTCHLGLVSVQDGHLGRRDICIDIKKYYG
ncbi:hypothetical protein MMYC01_203523 [Madurella mycetomatis]|uniref:Uncharacterized protein n=1 Tax=Madurella mycetomatis TaxID=100816 RepID=A0A175W6Q5_9PEZI|nr:hypothetical protein MMYC01_203523 [Madurella mycetomatis]